MYLGRIWNVSGKYYFYK